MKLLFPQQCLVLLVGSSGSGKSSFARKHFLPTEVVSSDVCRGLVSDDENDQKASNSAFELLHTMVRLRLQNGKFTVVDATNLRTEDRRELNQLAFDQDTLCAAVCFDTPKDLCKDRNALRPDRQFSSRVLDRHRSLFNQALRNIKKEKFHRVYRLDLAAQDSAVIERTPLWTDKRHMAGPFDIIGDLHGCFEELQSLLKKLGYENGRHPEGRTLIFVGDITDRGPRNVDCLRLVKQLVTEGAAMGVCGNHDAKLKRYLDGRKVQVSHGMEATAAELEEVSDEEKKGFSNFLDGLLSHYVFDQGKLVVAHAGIKEKYQGKASSRVRSFCLYGDTTGEVDEFGYPERLDWAADYRGDAMVVYGHTPVEEARWFNRTIDIDTGCAFGGKLTALRYPELELVEVPALATYAERKMSATTSKTTRDPHEIKLTDVAGKQIVDTRLLPNITIGPEQTAAALEVVSRHAVPPEWLVYLPPTMAPCSTSERENYLEYPEDAFSFYHSREQSKVICQEKHMGSRAVLYLKQSGEGRCLTRTGRPFFDPPTEKALVASLLQTLSDSGFWKDFRADWVLLDAELMPWSAKAQALLRDQYAAVASAAESALPVVVRSLRSADNPELQALLERQERRLQHARAFRESYRRYCWSTEGLEGVKLAPFHLLACSGQSFFDKTHRWHLDTLSRYLGQSAFFTATRTLELDLSDPEQWQKGCQWWLDLTEAGGEGMVVKPETFVSFGKSGILQPALKVRGREYLRIIYGPDYTDHLPALRRRAMGKKRSMALREFALGVEAIEGLVSEAPLYHIHRCVFAIMALESTPVDPRL